MLKLKVGDCVRVTRDCTFPKGQLGIVVNVDRADNR